MTTPPHKRWPPRLRRALRERLADRGLALPRGITFQYGPLPGDGEGRPPWITVMHRPGRSETCSVHDTHAPFRGDEDVAAVTDMAERHALAMIRRDAREEALVAAGHDARRPPLATLEARPLVALAIALVEAGLAGIDGGVGISNGRIEMNGVTLTTPTGAVEIERGDSLSIATGKDWPATVLTALRGRPLHEVVALPRCGRDDVDRAVAALTVTEADAAYGALRIRVSRARVVPALADDMGHDRAWLGMEPVPVA